MKFNYELLLKKIDDHYNMSKLEYKITALSKDIKVKIYRFRNILNNKAYFETDEIVRICEILGIPNKEIPKYFINIKNT